MTGLDNVKLETYTKVLYEGYFVLSLVKDDISDTKRDVYVLQAKRKVEGL